jgi:hypothetical protein
MYFSGLNEVTAGLILGSFARSVCANAGFSVEHGHLGYLREAYHGEPYATRVLVPESFETGRAEIPAATL